MGSCYNSGLCIASSGSWRIEISVCCLLSLVIQGRLITSRVFLSIRPSLKGCQRLLLIVAHDCSITVVGSDLTFVVQMKLTVWAVPPMTSRWWLGRISSELIFYTMIWVFGRYGLFLRRRRVISVCLGHPLRNSHWHLSLQLLCWYFIVRRWLLRWFCARLPTWLFNSSRLLALLGIVCVDLLGRWIWRGDLSRLLWLLLAKVYPWWRVRAAV